MFWYYVIGLSSCSFIWWLCKCLDCVLLEWLGYFFFMFWELSCFGEMFFCFRYFVIVFDCFFDNDKLVVVEFMLLVCLMMFSCMFGCVFIICVSLFSFWWDVGVSCVLLDLNWIWFRVINCLCISFFSFCFCSFSVGSFFISLNFSFLK